MIAKWLWTIFQNYNQEEKKTLVKYLEDFQNLRNNDISDALVRLPNILCLRLLSLISLIKMEDCFYMTAAIK